MIAVYNEIDRYCCDWLSNLMDAGLITPGKIDDRPIQELSPDDVAGYEFAHFFAGIGGWDYALQLAQYNGPRPLWTGSCPCQPFSSAGKLERFADPRHLWPTWVRLISERAPPIIFGEQVATATEWLRLVRSDLEALDYAVGAAPVEAACAGAFASGDRFWFVAAANGGDRYGRDSTMQMGRVWHPPQAFSDGDKAGDEWPAKPPVPLLAYAVPARMERCCAFGNAIDPICAAEFISASVESVSTI